MPTIQKGRPEGPNVVRIRGGIAKEAAKDILNKIDQTGNRLVLLAFTITGCGRHLGL